MVEVDRIVTILKPTRAFFDWVSKLPEADPDLTLEDMRSDCTALLIPAFDSPEDAEHYLEGIFEELLMNELDNWSINESLWPKRLNYELFCEWFDREHNSMVFDVAEETEEDDDEEDEEEFDYDEDEDSDVEAEEDNE